MIRHQQPPRGIGFPELLEAAIVHGRTLWYCYCGGI
jgi:hypothetical protein